MQVAIGKVALESASLIELAHDVKGVSVIVSKFDGYSVRDLRVAVDNIKSRLSSYVVVLGTVSEDGKVTLIAAVSKDLTSRIKAGELVGKLAKVVGGKGGGKPDLAQAGGNLPSELPNALSQVDSLLTDALS